jgi:predicted phage terminase large subunit-like protein
MSTILTPNDYNALLRYDLATFIERTFAQLDPKVPYLHNWHIDVIASKLTDCMEGRTRRLIINMPPRHAKSIAGSIAFVAWLLGHRPSARVIAVSYAQELALKLSMDTREVMRSPWYRRAFPRTRLASSPDTTRQFCTTQRGFRLATSVGGTITGLGGDFLILDDPLKPEDAVSDALRNKCNQWFDSSLYSRQNSKKTACIILIMHRLHEDDLVGHVLAQEPWEVVSFPAIAETNERYAFNTPWGPQVHTRAEGEALHPDYESLKALQQLRQTMGEYNFAGQYQQTPAPLGGGLVKAAWFGRYKQGELPEKFDQILCSWDTATKDSELADYSVCTTWGMKGEKLYLLDLYRKKVEFPDLKRAVVERVQAYPHAVTLIEDKSSGIQLIQELRAAGVHGVQGYKPQNTKVMRLLPQCPTIESGFVYLPESAPWLGEYLHELTTFPASKHDDQVDSTSMALEWVRIGRKNLGGLLFYQQEHEKELARARGEAHAG